MYVTIGRTVMKKRECTVISTLTKERTHRSILFIFNTIIFTSPKEGSHTLPLTNT